MIQMVYKKDKKYTFLHIKVKKTMSDMIDMIVKKDTHSTRSEFIRDAIREKLERMGLYPNIDKKCGGE